MTRTTRRRLLDRKIVEHLLQKRSKRWVIKNLKVGDRRVRRVIEAAKAFGYFDGAPSLFLKFSHFFYFSPLTFTKK